MRPHEVLDVMPGASRQEIAAAFRRFAFVHHPDRGGDSARFQAGVDAYRALVGARPWIAGGPDVVFHRRTRPGLASLLRLAGRRLSTFRPRS